LNNPDLMPFVFRICSTTLSDESGSNKGSVYLVLDHRLHKRVYCYSLFLNWAKKRLFLRMDDDFQAPVPVPGSQEKTFNRFS
jgi:hypothetical protein